MDMFKPNRLVQEILVRSQELGALKFGEFKLTAGGSSPYYFDGRLVTLDPKGAYLVSKAILPTLRKSKAESVAGPAIAAIPMVAAITLLSHVENTPMNGMIVRTDPKTHGTRKLIEGTIVPGSNVAVIDDTCSTGGSLFQAIQALEEAGCSVVQVICILDRRMGGSVELQEKGYSFISLLEADEEGNIKISQDKTT